MKILVALCLVLSVNIASASWVSEKVKKAETWVDRHVFKQGAEQAAISALTQAAVTTGSIARTSTSIEQTVAAVRTPLLTSAWLLAVLLLSAAVQSLRKTLKLLIPSPIPGATRTSHSAQEATTRVAGD